ncbi:MAG: hypothetical protein OM95_11820 [Bdellovibrio sp. ArHS]|uniref:hypothetical protein n=1 Tax=Bdellovibrio sp. ArHS TaxID=1569284 RepID=UPI000583DBBF|nr:hypothetical protein [Bdellovibrio sp. ArHS]KHD87946.1 MAG: hypothetical protein OM95_11820 [Bdellovibrio sp. ArHS]
MFKYIFLLALHFICSACLAQTGWQEVAFEKKYDELEGDAWLQALAQDQRYSVVLKLLDEKPESFPAESRDYYRLWSLLKSGQADSAFRVLSQIRNLSPRIQEMRFEVFYTNKKTPEAYRELRKILPEKRTARMFHFLSEKGLYQEAQATLQKLLLNPTIDSYELLETLSAIKTKSASTYKHWTSLFKILRPYDEISQQLWVEASVAYGPQTSFEALRGLCSTNSGYCYNTAEFFRQNDQKVQAQYWGLRIQNPLENLRFKINLWLDLKNYSQIAILSPLAYHSPLQEESRYQYAMAFSLVDGLQCHEAKPWLALLEKQQSPEQAKKIAKLRELCGLQ